MVGSDCDLGWPASWAVHVVLNGDFGAVCVAEWWCGNKNESHSKKHKITIKLTLLIGETKKQHQNSNAIGKENASRIF